MFDDGHPLFIPLTSFPMRMAPCSGRVPPLVPVTPVRSKECGAVIRLCQNRTRRLQATSQCMSDSEDSEFTVSSSVVNVGAAKDDLAPPPLPPGQYPALEGSEQQLHHIESVCESLRQLFMQVCIARSLDIYSWQYVFYCHMIFEFRVQQPKRHGSNVPRLSTFPFCALMRMCNMIELMSHLPCALTPY